MEIKGAFKGSHQYMGKINGKTFVVPHGKLDIYSDMYHKPYSDKDITSREHIVKHNKQLSKDEIDMVHDHINKVHRSNVKESCGGLVIENGPVDHRGAWKVGTRVRVDGREGEISHIRHSEQHPKYPHQYKITDVSAKDPYKQKRLEGGNYIPHNRVKPLHEENDALMLLKLQNKALRAFPSSPRQKEIQKQIEELRKKMKKEGTPEYHQTLKEESSQVNEGHNVFVKHQINIAKKTLKMHPAAVAVMGGPDHTEARNILKKHGWSDEQIKKHELSEDRKFDIYHKNNYHVSTTQSSTAKEAKEKYLKAYPKHNPSDVKVYPVKLKEENMSTSRLHIVRRVLDEATITRKHFQQVADIIKAHPDEKKRKELAQHHAEIFKKANPRFDHSRFYSAAGVKMNEETELDLSEEFKEAPPFKGKENMFPSGTTRIQKFQHHSSRWKKLSFSPNKSDETKKAADWHNKQALRHWNKMSDSEKANAHQSFNESVQLNEISKDKLKRYIHAASWDASRAGMAAGHDSANQAYAQKKGYDVLDSVYGKSKKANIDKIRKRTAGILKATQKLEEEETQLDESTTRLKTINSHKGMAQWHAEASDEPVGYISSHHMKHIPSPHSYSPTNVVYKWNGKNVVAKETRHKHYEIHEVPGHVTIHKNDDDALGEFKKKDKSLNEGYKENKKAEWMREFEKHVTSAEPRHHGKIDWDSAHYLHNQKHSAKDAAHAYIKNRIGKQLTEELERMDENVAKYKTGDGKKHLTLDDAKKHAESVYKKSGKIISVEHNFHKENAPVWLKKLFPHSKDNRHGFLPEKERMDEMVLKGHPYHKKSDAELHFIAKDAKEAMDAIGTHDKKAASKYADQMNDALSVLHHRRKGGKQLTEVKSSKYNLSLTARKKDDSGVDVKDYNVTVKAFSREHALKKGMAHLQKKHPEHHNREASIIDETFSSYMEEEKTQKPKNVTHKIEVKGAGAEEKFQKEPVIVPRQPTQRLK